MKTIDDYFSSTPSTTLYHYTGIGGLLGMVENRKIWASNAYYLNDSKEILHSCDVLSEVLEEKITNLHDEEQNFFDQLKKWIGKIRNENNNIFIILNV